MGVMSRRRGSNSGGAIVQQLLGCNRGRVGTTTTIGNNRQSSSFISTPTLRFSSAVAAFIFLACCRRFVVRQAETLEFFAGSDLLFFREQRQAAMLNGDNNNKSGGTGRQVLCWKSFADRLPGLIDAVHSRPERDGLRPVRDFAGFDDDLTTRAFERQRIVFLGDSTLKSVSRYLKLVLDDDNYFPSCGNITIGTQEEPPAARRQHHRDWSTMTLQEANNVMSLFKLGCAARSEMPAGRTFVEFTGITGSPHRGGAEERLLQAWNVTSTVYRPTILVVNIGLHWQHFVGHGRDLDGMQVRRWVFYEEQWLQDAIDRAKRMGSVRVMLFKTVNLICSDGWYGAYSNGDKAYTAALSQESTTQSRLVLRQCETRVKEIIRRDNVTLSADQVSRYCRHGLFNDHGARYLNDRMYRFIAEHLPDDLPFKVGIFNDHDIQSCNYTQPHDGRHYFDMNMVRLRVLGNILSCANDRDTDTVSFNEETRRYASRMLRDVETEIA